jgi:hypothetical protein
MPGQTLTAALAKHFTTTAGTADTVTLSVDYYAVEVKNRATAGAGISFTVDGSAPTALADDTYVVLPGEALVVRAPKAVDAVKLFSATADPVSVTGVLV